MRIGFIGNFEPPYSTENDRKWSFMMLGHDVIKFQENKTTIDDLIYAVTHQQIDFFVYSHTHGWEIPGLIRFFDFCKNKNIPTISVHLDRWAWLERENDIGKEATWFTQWQFMADASPEAVELYEKHGLQNWHYLKPGVVARDCYQAAPDPVKFPHEIVFVGSKNYHKEYPFRPQLVEWLHKTYGKRFGHYGGGGYETVRGHDLNVLYATAKIVVGDSCFGGRPNYVSDRYYETRGRGGFLLHPKVTGVDDVGVAHYEAGNLKDLKKQIDYWLKNWVLRKEIQNLGFSHVAAHETYTNRAQEIIDTLYEKNTN